MKKTLRVGGGLQDAAMHFLEVWQRIERGEAVEPEDNVTFLTWSALAAVMTDKRHEMLCHLRRHPAPSVRALARDLGRDYKRVHADVEALARVGLIERDKTAVRVTADEIQASLRL